MISTELYGRMSQGTNVKVFYWLAFVSSQPMGIFGTYEKVAILIPIVTCTLPIPIRIFGIFVFPFPWDSRGNGNPIPMHIARLQPLCRSAVITRRFAYLDLPSAAESSCCCVELRHRHHFLHPLARSSVYFGQQSSSTWTPADYKLHSRITLQSRSARMVSDGLQALTSCSDSVQEAFLNF